MRFALMTEPQQGLSYVEQLELALLAERLGFEAFFRSDHYRSFPGPTDKPTTDAWAVLAGLAREPRQDRPGVGRWLVGRAGEAAVVVRPEERLETEPFGQQRQLKLFDVAQPLLGLGHQRETHRLPPGRLVGHRSEWLSQSKPVLDHAS